MTSFTPQPPPAPLPPPPPHTHTRTHRVDIITHWLFRPLMQEQTFTRVHPSFKPLDIGTPFQIQLFPPLKVQRMVWLGLPLWWELEIIPLWWELEINFSYHRSWWINVIGRITSKKFCTSSNPLRPRDIFRFLHYLHYYCVLNAWHAGKGVRQMAFQFSLYFFLLPGGDWRSMQIVSKGDNLQGMSGTILWNGRDITDLSSAELAQSGIYRG